MANEKKRYPYKVNYLLIFKSMKANMRIIT